MIPRSSSVDQYEQLRNEAPHWYMDAMQLNEVVDYYEERGQHADAEQCLRLALKLHPADDDLKVKWAYILRSKGQTEEAKQIISQLPESNLDVRFFKAEVALAHFDLETAEHIFQQILTDDSEISPDWHLRTEIAECYQVEGYTAEALRMLSQIPEDSEESVRAHLMKADCYYNLHETTRAITELNIAIDRNPYDVSSWGMLAELQYESGKYAEAQEACQYALAVNPTDEKALRVSFFAYKISHDHNKALEQAAIYVKHWPNEYYLPMNAGELCVEEGRITEAIEYYGRANQNCPDEHQDRMRILADVAQAQTHQGKLEEAFRTLKCVCRYGASYYTVCVQMAGLAAEINDMQFAAERLNETLPAVQAYNTEICTLVISLMREYQMLFVLCPDITSALQNFNTSIS